MNDKELKFLLGRLGIVAVPLMWLCLPALIAITVADELIKKINRNARQP
jgi:hypothetical protein